MPGQVSQGGRADGPPVLPPGRAATRARELSAWIADSTADRANPVTLDGARLLAERAAFTGHTRNGATSAGGSARLLPTADGWAAVSCARPDDPALFGALICAGIDEDAPWPAIAAWVRVHSGAELADRVALLGLAASPVAAGTRPPAPHGLQDPRPVEGLLVVDFSALWAGPLCAHLLGLAGARVVKVETPTRPDGARRGNPDFYALLHGGHRAVSLDPATDAAAAGGTTWISITASGRGSDQVGFGDDVAAGAGLIAAVPGGPVDIAAPRRRPGAGLAVLRTDGVDGLWPISLRPRELQIRIHGSIDEIDQRMLAYTHHHVAFA